MKVHYSSKSNEWTTPQFLFDYLDSIYNFELDPCATHENHKCDKYFTKEDDGLKQNWYGNVFINPPYAREIKHWVKKAHDEYIKHGGKKVLLIPARTDTIYMRIKINKLRKPF